MCYKNGPVSLILVAAQSVWVKNTDRFYYKNKIVLIEDWLIYRRRGVGVSEGSRVVHVYWDIKTKNGGRCSLLRKRRQLPQIANRERVAQFCRRAKELDFRDLVYARALWIRLGGRVWATCGGHLFGEHRSTLRYARPTASLRLTAQVMPVHYFAMAELYVAHLYTVEWLNGS
jgi:hypothetical protein